jgi:hypothetical protein
MTSSDKGRLIVGVHDLHLMGEVAAKRPVGEINSI